MHSVFVINLDNRQDRWSDVQNQSKELTPLITRIRATTPQEVSTTHYTSLNVAACWLSHKNAMLEFLNSESKFAIIFEDDFQLFSGYSRFKVKDFEDSNLDFLQLGFLRTTLKESIYILIENTYDSLIRLFGFLEMKILRSRNSRKLLVQERKLLSRKFVYADIRPGAHAYIINRDAAEYFVGLNNPIFLSTDDLFMAVAPMRHIRMARVRKSLVGQSGSSSSIRV